MKGATMLVSLLNPFASSQSEGGSQAGIELGLISSCGFETLLYFGVLNVRLSPIQRNRL
jgi:hypothetical protein